MDKTSPVFENFENKMAAMSGGPKINRSTFKIGSSNLTERVANNEKKITTLKNIFKAQRIQIGEKLTPKVNVLEESLIRTNAIITDVAAQLEKDFSQRLDAQKALLAKEKQNKLDDKRQDKEGRIEAVKVAKFVKSTASTVTKPFKNIFDKLLDFGKLFLAGVGVNASLKWLSNPENLLKFQKMLDLIVERPLISLAAFGGAALIISTVISKIIGGFRKVIFTLLNPMTYVDLFSGKTFRNFLPKMQKLINKAGKRTMKGALLKKIATTGVKKTGIKALGALPLIGNFIDVGAAIYRFSKGDVVGGFLSLGSAIPVLGWGIAAIDIAREFGAFEGSILQKQQETESKAIGGNVTAGTYYRTNDGPDGATEYFKPHMGGTILTPIQAQREFNYARTQTNNFGNGPRITTVDLPPEFVKKSVPQTKPGKSTETTPFLETTDSGNHFIAERVASIGGVA